MFHKCIEVVVKNSWKFFAAIFVTCILDKYLRVNMALFSVFFLKSTFVL